MEKILTKSSFYHAYNAGALGNKPKTWNSYSEIVQSGYRGSVSMRSAKGIERKKVNYAVPFELIPQEIEKWEREGQSARHIRFNETMPDNHLVLQGEVIGLEQGWVLRYSQEQVPMNQALENSQTVQGLRAKLLLRQHMDPDSFDQLQLLMDTYDGTSFGKDSPAIELGIYDVPVGNIPRRNTIFWEVRHY